MTERSVRAALVSAGALVLGFGLVGLVTAAGSDLADGPIGRYGH